MSGSTIGGVVGGVIGAFFGNPQLGFMLGSAIGGAIDPEVIKAPSIGDAQKQSSQPGVPRPVVYGHPAPFAGNIIDGEHKARKIKVRERQGKGGPVVESERFLLTSAVRICEGPIGGVLRIWRNGEVVYDVRRTEDVPPFAGGSAADFLQYMAEIRARSASFAQKVRIYTGTEDQLPDPALEALHGVGNTPYYRGTAYMVIEDDDVTDMRGAAAQYRFEVVSAATEASLVMTVPTVSTNLYSGNGGGAYGTIFPSSTAWSTVHARSTMPVIRLRATRAGTTSAATANPVRVVYKSPDGGVLHDSGWMGDPAYQSDLDAILTAANRSSEIGPISPAAEQFKILSMVGGYTDVLTSVTGVIVIDGTTFQYSAYVDEPDPANLPATFDIAPEVPGLIIGGDGVLYRPEFVAPASLTSITASQVTLASVAADIADRCNVPASKIDVSTLVDVLPGFLVAEQFTGADALRPLQQAFFFDMPDYDGAIRAVKRGGAAVTAVTDNDLVETDQRDEVVRAQAIEYPLKVSVVTQDPAAEYAAIPQTSGRASPDFQGTSEVVVQLPVPFGATESARIAHKIHKVLHSQAEGRVELTLPDEFSRYVPSDTFTYRDRRWLIEESRYADGVCRWKAVYDRASAYSSTVSGQSAAPPTLPGSGLVGATVFAAMNLPRLSTSQTTPGMYLAARGSLAGWAGCVVQLSVDGGETFSSVATITDPAIIASLSAAAGAADTVLSVTTRSGDQLSSVSAAQLEAKANAFALGFGVPEVGQFQTATETAANAYSLSNVTRGGLGTTAASHAAATPFVLLDAAIIFLPLDISLAGRTLIFRPVSFGTAEANAPTYSVVYEPQFTGAQVIEPLTVGGQSVNSNGSPIYVVTNA